MGSNVVWINLGSVVLLPKLCLNQKCEYMYWTYSVIIINQSVNQSINQTLHCDLHTFFQIYPNSYDDLCCRTHTYILFAYLCDLSIIFSIQLTLAHHPVKKPTSLALWENIRNSTWASHHPRRTRRVAILWLNANDEGISNTLLQMTIIFGTLCWNTVKDELEQFRRHSLDCIPLLCSDWSDWLSG